MQTVKLSSWVCALAISSGMTIQADDTPAQAAARAALLEKMQELNGATTPAASVSGASWSDVTMSADASSNDPNAAARAALLQKLQELDGTPAASASGSKNLPVTVPQPLLLRMKALEALQSCSGILTAPAPTPAPVAQDSEAAARARAALLEKLHELDGTPVVLTPVTAVLTNITPVTAAVTPVASSPEDHARTRAALMQELGVPANASPANAGTHVTAARTVAAAPVPAARPPRTSRRNRELPPLVFTPVKAPVLPLTSTQAEQLQTLLDQYRADQITPQQYHDQRAAILAVR